MQECVGVIIIANLLKLISFKIILTTSSKNVLVSVTHEEVVDVSPDGLSDLN